MQDKQLIRAQVESLYSQSAITFLFPVLMSIILGFVLWEVAHQYALIAWILVIWIYAAFRFVLLWKFNKTEITLENAPKWLDVFIGSVCISGIMWGLAAIILVPHEGTNIMEFTLYTGITLLSVSGLVAGATISYSVCLPSCFSILYLPYYHPPSISLPWEISITVHWVDLYSCIVFSYPVQVTG